MPLADDLRGMRNLVAAAHQSLTAALRSRDGEARRRHLLGAMQAVDDIEALADVALAFEPDAVLKAAA